MTDNPEKAKSPVVENLGDFLAPRTRVDRQNLLVSSGIVMIIIGGGLVPTKLSIVGLEFDKFSPEIVRLTAIAIQLFFLISFSVTGGADLLVRRHNTSEANLDTNAKSNLSKVVTAWTYLIVALDVVVPVVIGLAVLVYAGCIAMN